jgi:hypothetical protein
VEAAAESTEAELSANSRTYVTARRDVRKCAVPRCGGYFVRDVNRKNPREEYVREFDFSNAQLTSDHQQHVRDAGDWELVLLGKLGPMDAVTNTRAFLVDEAWRGLPGVSSSRNSSFHRVNSKAEVVRCASAPCLSDTAETLNSTSKSAFSSYDLQGVLKPRVDELWLHRRITHHGALVAGELVDGQMMAAGPERVLRAKQVYIRLPESQAAACTPPAASTCPAGQVMSYVRNADRCWDEPQCVPSMICPMGVPACPEGYSLNTWPSRRGGCSGYACDPDFTF